MVGAALLIVASSASLTLSLSRAYEILSNWVAKVRPTPCRECRRVETQCFTTCCRLVVPQPLGSFPVAGAMSFLVDETLYDIFHRVYVVSNCSGVVENVAEENREEMYGAGRVDYVLRNRSNSHINRSFGVICDCIQSHLLQLHTFAIPKNNLDSRTNLFRRLWGIIWA